MTRKKRVLVGMSGGVDSSVTAALLKKRGYDVIGITMQLLPKADAVQSSCCNLGATNDAKRVAALLKIPHYTINSRDTFQKNVIDNFIAQYASGLTPNPCISCNRHIKFDELWSKANDLDADFIATGHYSKITRSPKTGRCFLKKAKDPQKDQSYFLYMMTQETLQRTLFPLGNFYKPEIRDIARSLNLINANKPDSQDICFVAQSSYKDYVKSHIPEARRRPGKITDINGQELGNHSGIYQFTIGQRRGLNLSSPTPLYVLNIDPSSNTVTVGHRGELTRRSIHLHTVTLVDEDEPILNRSFELKLRYQMAPVWGEVTHKQGTKITLELRSDQDSVTPGQSCVMYDRDRIVGGGIISQT